MPFIDAYVQLGRWDEAVKVTLDAGRKFPISRLTSCDYWNALPATVERDQALQKLGSRFDCFRDE
jgi:hypothetical protein